MDPGVANALIYTWQPVQAHLQSHKKMSPLSPPRFASKTWSLIWYVTYQDFFVVAIFHFLRTILKFTETKFTSAALLTAVFGQSVKGLQYKTICKKEIKTFLNFLWALHHHYHHDTHCALLLPLYCKNFLRLEGVQLFNCLILNAFTATTRHHHLRHLINSYPPFYVTSAWYQICNMV